MPSRKAVLFSSIFGILVITGTALGLYFGLFYEPEPHNNGDGEEAVVLTLNSLEQTKNFTLSEIKELTSTEGYGGYKKSTGTIVGLNYYKGVDLFLLLNHVGGITQNDELNIIASDGWTITYSYNMVSAQVTAYDNQTGENLGLQSFQVILAYEIDGENLPNSDGPLRIVYLSENGYLTDGNLWAKLVRTIDIVTASSWVLYLYGITNDSLDKSTFEAALYSGEENHSTFYILEENERNNTYEGIPLWVILSVIDGELPENTHYTFNESLALQGYEIELVSKFDEKVILNISEVMYNNNILMAYKRNSVFLGGLDAPLRLVGEGLATLEMLAGINEVWIKIS